MKAVITVIGRDRVGILAKVATACASFNVNIEDVTQTILKGTFAMIMLVDLENSSADIQSLGESLCDVGSELGVEIRVTRQELYDDMHRI